MRTNNSEQSFDLQPNHSSGGSTKEHDCRSFNKILYCCLQTKHDVSQILKLYWVMFLFLSLVKIHYCDWLRQLPPAKPFLPLSRVTICFDDQLYVFVLTAEIIKFDPHCLPYQTVYRAQA